MTDYIVRYTLHAYIYETTVRTASSAAAMYWVMNAFPDATNIQCINSDNGY